MAGLASSVAVTANAREPGRLRSWPPGGVNGSVSEPVVLHNEPEAPNGRGMAIVEAMSTRWGVQAHGDGGKTVWFELDLADY